MKPVSDARRERDKHLPERRAEALDRAANRCEVRALGCTWTATQIHHRRGRVPIDGDDPHDPDLLIAVRLECHTYIEEHREWAYERGWLLSRMGTVRPPAWAQGEDT